MKLPALATLAFLTLGGGAASAASIDFTVFSKTNGRFGVWELGGVAMALGPQLSAGEVITISATGTISLGEIYHTVTADGVDVDSSSGHVSTWEYTPLEEAGVDANPTLANATLMPGLGALMGAFIPQTTVDAPGFTALDTDVGGDIQSSDLFLVGSSLVFTAGYDGTLFFGINEGYVANNTGSHIVTVTPGSGGGAGIGATVPLPAGLPLLLGALGGLALLRRKRP